MKILSILIPWLVCIFYPIYGWAACSWSGNTGTVGSPYTASDVQACITDAASKTGSVIIQIPNSTVTWSSGITVNMRSGFTNVTGLTIRGQNDCTLTNSATPSPGFDYPTACGTNITNMFVLYTGLEGKSFRLAHMRATGTAGVRIEGDNKSWRLDHIFWDTVTGYSGSRIIYISATNSTWLTEGLIDHNYFLNPAWGAIFHHQTDYNSSNDGGNYVWMTDLGLGTSHAVYIESNKIYSNIAGYYLTDNEFAARWAFRYNNITNAGFTGHDFTAANAAWRGIRKIEVYNNILDYPIDGNCWTFYRAGNGVFFNNTITKYHPGDNCGSGVSLSMWRTDCASASGKSYLATTSHIPGTCSSGTGCIDIDGKGSPDGYPCRDQIGASGNDPQVGGGQPYLLWNNTFNGGVLVIGADENYVKSGRDYCLSSTTMPSTCNGVTTTYAPYYYPHPLTGPSSPITGPSSPITGPSSPQNLRIPN